MLKKHTPTILVVDDDRAILQAIKRRLTTWKYKVLTAENGREGFARAESEKPDVVVTDLYMPGADGFELLKNLVSVYPDLPVIILSGQGDLVDAIKALRMGAWDYIYKPIPDMSFFALALERALEKAELIRENRQYRRNLEAQVAEKSAELVARQAELIEKATSLEAANKALTALVEQREIEKKAIEQTLLLNLKRYIFPYLDELESKTSGRDNRSVVQIMRANIEQLLLPVSQSLSGAYLSFTPAETKVADFIRQGKSVKDIADALNVSPSTVEKHRNKIRHKLGLIGKKVNLGSYLNSLAE